MDSRTSECMVTPSNASSLSSIRSISKTNKQTAAATVTLNGVNKQIASSSFEAAQNSNNNNNNSNETIKSNGSSEETVNAAAAAANEEGGGEVGEERERFRISKPTLNQNPSDFTLEPLPFTDYSLFNETYSKQTKN